MMDSSFYGLEVHDEDRPVFQPTQVSQPVFPDFLHRQGPQPGPVTQSFPGIPTSGFFNPNQINRFAPPWSPNPMPLRQEGGSHRPNGPINYSLNQSRPGSVALSAAGENSRDSTMFAADDFSSNSNHAPQHQPTTQSHSQPPPPAQHQIPRPTQNKCPSIHTLRTRAMNTDTTKPFSCGGCDLSFETMCKLHKHLKIHGGNGSYVYDNITQTAHPRYRTITKETQTYKGGAKEAQKVKEQVEFVEKLLKGTIENSENRKAGAKSKFGKPIKGGKAKKAKPDEEKTKEEIEAELAQKAADEAEEEEARRRAEEEAAAEAAASENRPEKYRKARDKKIATLYSEEKLREVYRLKKRTKPKMKKIVNVCCPQCNLDFPTKCTTPVKIPRGGKVPKKVKEPQEKIVCDICQKKLTAKSALKHIKKCLGLPQFTCPQEDCGKTFRRKKSLLLHQRSHIVGTPFTCDICGLGYSTPEKLTKHMIMHTENRPWKCDRCPMCFKAKDHLQRHIRTHTKELPYICHCGKAFAQNWNLQAHMRSHTGEKPYKCEICGKGFAHNAGRKKHMRSHPEAAAVVAAATAGPTPTPQPNMPGSLPPPPMPPPIPQMPPMPGYMRN